jgi:putative NADH-flavin reductase
LLKNCFHFLVSENKNKRFPKLSPRFDVLALAIGRVKSEQNVNVCEASTICLDEIVKPEIVKILLFLSVGGFASMQIGSGTLDLDGDGFSIANIVN